MSPLARTASNRNLAGRGHKALAVFATAALALGFSACSPSENGTSPATMEPAVTSAMDKDEIIIGFDNTFVPMGFDEGGVTKGFDVDLATAAAEKLGKKFVFQNIDWNLKETELNSGKIDAIWNGYSYSDERAKKVAMTDPYMTNQQIIMVLADSPVKSKADLAGKTVAVQAGSTGADAVTKDADFQASLAGGQPAAYDTFDKALRDLEVGRADAVVGDSVLLNYYAKQKGLDKFTTLDENFGEESFVVAVRSNDTKFKDALNEFLQGAKSDGTIEKATNTWFK
ncbi:amino acid ABC transporter substrate-binding protein [Boudabousia marimammalium]|uniref:Solute-binding protein family 3/N-terminal domain-containing protein n=1 Tax=Boudabousia marimammalium TaxID=156892 RepID=A0A1Q5PRU8_9ACTO|nr:amino acid ABC transporter substrate-binding protein [Boudabousia marimammalium]OKL50286.1 hypothetical protein BM477_02540 [Boudabousia marimammalium]